MTGSDKMQSIKIKNRGFTLIELMTATVLVVIVTFGIAVMFYNGQRGWNAMYNNIYSDVVTEGYVAKNRFDTVVRKSSIQNVVLDDTGQYLGWIVEILETGANDVFVVRSDHRADLLLPYLNDLVIKVDLDQGEYHTRLIPGLLSED